MNQRNEETGLVRSTVTDERGWYRLSALLPGRYELAGELSGFATIRRPGIVLTIGQEATIHIQMRLVTVQETVTVIGESPLVEASKTTLGTTITADKLEELPLQGRNYLNLITLAAGVAPDGGASGLAFSATRNSGRGGFVVDGVSQTRTFFPVRGSLSPDAVQEFQVLTNMFSAEYGTASGPIVNILTRPGTNEIRGTAAVYSRNDRFDARHYFARGKAPFAQQFFVGNLGGAIARDRLHYFASFEGFRQNETVVVTSPLQPGELPLTQRRPKLLAKLDGQLGVSNHATVRGSVIPTRTTNQFGWRPEHGRAGCA